MSGYDKVRYCPVRAEGQSRYQSTRGLDYSTPHAINQNLAERGLGLRLAPSVTQDELTRRHAAHKLASNDDQYVLFDVHVHSFL